MHLKQAQIIRLKLLKKGIFNNYYRKIININILSQPHSWDIHTQNILSNGEGINTVKSILYTQADWNFNIEEYILAIFMQGYHLHVIRNSQYRYPCRIRGG